LIAVLAAVSSGTVTLASACDWIALDSVRTPALLLASQAVRALSADCKNRQRHLLKVLFGNTIFIKNDVASPTGVAGSASVARFASARAVDFVTFLGVSLVAFALVLASHSVRPARAFLKKAKKLSHVAAQQTEDRSSKVMHAA